MTSLRASLLLARGSQRSGVGSHVGVAVPPSGGSDVAMCRVVHLSSLPDVVSGDYLPAGATLERLTPKCTNWKRANKRERDVSRSSVVIQSQNATSGRTWNQFRKGGYAMGMTHRITVPAVEETADVTALLMEFYREWRGMLFGGIDGHEELRIERYLQRLRQEQDEAAIATSEADFHMEMIAGWTRVGGPNEKSVRHAREDGRKIDDRHTKRDAA